MKDRKNSSLLRRLEKFQRLFFVALLSVLAVGAFAQKTRRAKLFFDERGEYIIPERYSMAPVFRAENEVQPEVNTTQ